MDLLYRKREAHYELIVSQRRSHCTQWLEKDRIITMFQIKITTQYVYTVVSSCLVLATPNTLDSSEAKPSSDSAAPSLLTMLKVTEVPSISVVRA